MQLVQHGYIVERGSIVGLGPIVEQLVDDPSDCRLELVDSSDELVDPSDCKLELLGLGCGGQRYHRLGIQGTLIKKFYY